MKTTRRNFLLNATSLVALPCLLAPAASAGASNVPKADLGEPWDLKSFPDMLATAFFQEDVSAGPVAVHKGRGIFPLEASQPVENLRPEKIADRGVVFSGARNLHLRFRNVKDSLRLYRWCLTVTRLSKPTGGRAVAQIVSVNDGSSAQNCHPKITLDGAAAEARLQACWHGAAERGTVKAFLNSDGFAFDAWNINLTYRRNGRLFSSLNGVDSGYVNDIVDWAWPSVEGGPESIIGGKRSANTEWGYDCIVLGQGELTEAMVRKLEGWAAWRVARQGALPAGHPYRLSRPVVDAEDVGLGYRFDEAAWLRWGSALRGSGTSARIGKPAEDRSDFQRVFYDAAGSKGPAASMLSSGSAPTWFAPGWNSAVGASAQLLPPTAKVKLYEQTAGGADGSGGVMTLSLKHQNKWFAPAIYTVNDAGQGHSWEGETIFRLRCRMSSYDKVPGGFFPGFWSYALQPLFTRHLERIEIDFWELDGKNPIWLNGGSSHVHSASFPGVFGHLTKDAKRFKVWAGELTAARLGIEKDFTPWDGKWHTWEFAIEKEFTTLSVSVDKSGREEMIELYRCPTPVEYLERRYVIVNYALRLEDGEPDRSISHDLQIASFEVLQKAEKLGSFALPFIALPIILGTPRLGQSLKCEHGLSPGITDIWYYWYADGCPRLVSPSPVFKPEAEDLGKTLRCMVKAVGAKGQPEAWSPELRPAERPN
jgi:hypothetical protein